MNSTHSKVGDVIKSRLLTVSHCSDAMLSRVCSCYYVCRLNSGALLGTYMAASTKRRKELGKLH